MSLTRNQKLALEVLREQPERAFSPGFLAVNMVRKDSSISVRAGGAIRAAEVLIRLGLAQRAQHEYASSAYRAAL